MADRNEFVGLMVEAITTTRPSNQAGIMADWLEDNGGPEDAWLFAMLRWLQLGHDAWNCRPYRVAVPFDVNYASFIGLSHVRQPVPGTTWAIIAYGVLPIGYRILRILPSPALWVRLPWGQEGSMEPLPSVTGTVLTMVQQGVPLIPPDPPAPTPTVVRTYLAHRHPPVIV